MYDTKIAWYRIVTRRQKIEHKPKTYFGKGINQMDICYPKIAIVTLLCHACFQYFIWLYLVTSCIEFSVLQFQIQMILIIPTHNSNNRVKYHNKHISKKHQIVFFNILSHLVSQDLDAPTYIDTFTVSIHSRQQYIHNII